MAESQPGSPGWTDIRGMLGTAYPAFDKLLEWGCKDLGALVLFLRLSSVPSNRGKGRKLELHRADSHELLLNGNSLRAARTRIKQARAALDKFRKALEPLEGARIWQKTDVIRYHKDQAEQFLGWCLDSLSDALDKTGPKAHPSITRSIERVVSYVREQTGQYHDGEVAEIISAAIGNPAPPGYPSFPSAEALKMWRIARGISDPQEGKLKVPES